MSAGLLSAFLFFSFLLLFLSFLPVVASAAGTGGGVYKPSLYGTYWSLLPPVIAIVLAFLTREANSALFLGTLSGAFLYADFRPMRTLEHVVKLTAGELGANGGIVVFLIALGIIVAMMQVSGCTTAYGNWASRRIRSKRSALLATTVTGLMLSIDDYFNCLTNGNIMRPITDRHRVSRARLAYNIDCTSAPICIIAPVSSWAAAVASYVPAEYGIDGFAVFIRTIPYNYYAILTLVMLFTLAILGFDFGPMRKYEKMAEEGDIYGGTGDLYASTAKPSENPRGTASDMILPVFVLIASCVSGLLYTGGFFDGRGVGLMGALSDCDAFLGLPIGGLIALFFTVFWYLLRGIVTPKEFAKCIPDGFHLMVPAMLILIFSWTLSSVCRTSLGATAFVSGAVQSGHFNLHLLPAILFILGAFISFSTGTSWGTFGILIPITLAIFGGEVTQLAVICLSATLAGAVAGDHCSPISETAVMSSTAAQVDFMQHVMTQLPYAIFVAAFAALGFAIAGFIQNAPLVLTATASAMVATLYGVKRWMGRKG